MYSKKLGHGYRNCQRMAINTLVQQLCREDEAGVVGLLCWEVGHVHEGWAPSKWKGCSSVCR